MTHHEIYSFFSSEGKNRWEKTKWEQRATIYYSNTIDGDEFRNSLTYQIHPNNINTQRTKRIQICRLILRIEGSGDGG